MYCLFVLFYVLFVCKCALLPPGANPTAVKYISNHIISYISYHIAMTQSSTKICQSCCSKWPIMQDDKHEQNQPTMLSRIPTLEIVWGSDSVT